MSKRVNVGVIGGGLMGREVASAFGRWFALDDSNNQFYSRNDYDDAGVNARNRSHFFYVTCLNQFQ